jgi:hypothetical protein
VNRVAFVVLYSASDAALPIVADIDDDGKATLWTRTEDLDVDEIAERTGMSRRDVMASIEEKAAELFERAPVADDDPPSRREEQ